jgi:large subunit ribosomal protein L25
MAKSVLLKAATRNGIGRTALKGVRKAGNVPGVLYGKKASQAIEINAKELIGVLQHASSENVLVDLELKSNDKTEKRLALIQDIQHHPLKDYVIHVDLHELAADEKLHTEVTVETVGEPAGVKTGGGLLEVVLRHLRVECLPKDLPEIITIDVSHLEIGQAIHVGEIQLPAGVTVLNPKDLPVVAVAAPTKEEEPVAAAAAEVAQPEVIKEKKADDAPAADAKGGAKAEAKK